ncbi:MAG: undecaprenyldiphospho-muramoylpentapeptide beta-N-acetylglucosaminyltransferase [Gammaproteobacteria bacterium]|nr:undecaprenyldiphospho-muramoylpentapeptide beta-N-acetylglucosaminyltransferase [Gammaproteobacteria bacterium]|tara:strand:- start:4859 stop:5941 length:1083 start_codon:yes stop_codon:yes gene_type:complete
MDDKERKIVIFSGGTGGHIYPGIAIAKKLKNLGVKVLWIGTRKGLEATVVPAEKIEIKFINFSGVRGKGIRKYLMLPFTLFRAIWQSIKIISDFKPNLAISMGGYIAIPNGIVSIIFRIPIVIHEQNIIYGLSNSMLKIFAHSVILGFPKKKISEKEIYMGNPIRPSIKIKKISENIEDNKINILVFGGSLGAKKLNKVVPEAIAIVQKNNKDRYVQVIHQTGSTYDIAVEEYSKYDIKVTLKNFIENMNEAYNWADIIICRAGAITLSEIMKVGIPAIVVPYPFAADNHQYLNAKFLEDNGALVMIEDNSLSPDVISKYLENIIGNNELRVSLSRNIQSFSKNNADEDIANYLANIIDK